MTLRCRPGDLAVIVRAAERYPRSLGALVRVHYLAPVGTFHRMPNGVLNRPSMPNSWVVEFPHEIVMPNIYGDATRNAYWVVPDEYLRPIRPGAEPVEVEHQEPAEVTA